MAEVFSTYQLKQGALALDFALPDADGKITKLHAATGRNGVLIVFACNHCPYVVHLAEELGKFSKEIAAQGITTIAINSNDIVRYPLDGPVEMKAFAAKYDWDFPYLLDESQEVAHAYGAACTPDFFLFDGEKRLAYTGQFDDSRPRKTGATTDPMPVTGQDLRNAIHAMLRGETPRQGSPSSGCNIKWKDPLP